MRSSRLPLAGLILLALLRSTAADAEERDRVAFVHPLRARTDYYGLYRGRAKVGWGRTSLALERDGRTSRYVIGTHYEADVVLPDLVGRFVFEVEDVFDGEPPFALLRSQERLDQGASRREVRLAREGSALVGSVSEDGETRTVRLEGVDTTLVDRLTHAEWARTRPEAGARVRVRELDISNLRLETWTYEVRSRERFLAGALEVDGARVDMGSTRQSYVGSALLDAQGRTLQGTVAVELDMRLESEVQALRRDWPSRLGGLGRAPVASRLGTPQGIRRLRLKVYGRPARGLAPLTRARAEWDPDELGLDLDVAASPAAALPDASTPDRPLGASREATLAAWAQEAVGHARADDERLARLLAYVPRRLTRAWAPHEPSVDVLLREPAGDASEFARLFVALAREVGLSAREVGGLVYLGDQEQAFGAHVWCEVAMGDTWREVDPSRGLGGVDGTYLLLSRDPSELPARWAESQELAFEVREVER